jgi:CubicO group peptidase (beta-lactamase class C family)
MLPIRSVLVTRGSLFYERYFHGASAETLHDTRSATKSVTALAVGAAIGAGLLPGVDAPAFHHLAHLEPFAHDGDAKRAITVEDVLTMSSALDCDDGDPASPGNEENMYPQESWARWAADLPVRDDYRRDADGRGPFHYCTAGAFLLGQMLESAGKRPVDQLFAERLFAPLGIQRWEFSRSPSGEPMTGGGLRLRSRDLAALAWLLLHEGQWHGEQVVPAEFVRAAMTVQREATPQQSYGYLLWTRDYRTPCGEQQGWLMGGNGGNAVVVFPDLDATVVVTRTHYNKKGMHEQTTRLIEEQILPELACGARLRSD